LPARPNDGVRELLQANAVPGLGAVRYLRLIERFGSWAAVQRASDQDLLRVEGIGAVLVAALRRPPDLDVSRELGDAEDLGIQLVPYWDERYPQGLKDLHAPPLLLYVRGMLLPQDRLALAIVGSRRSTYYGHSQAQRLAHALAKMGFCIVSGLAHGIDAAAHRAALLAGGRTIAVLGCGLKRIYPPDHAELATEVAAHGALISELPLATPPRPSNFPPRNRIIAALALGTIVIEAPRRSGALITARWAAELNRQVYAVPGQADSPQSRGSNALLQDGAKLVLSVDDVLSELGPVGEAVAGILEEPVDNPRALALNPQEKRIYSALGSQPQSIDDIVRATNLPAAGVSATLMVLEIRGLVRQLPGKRFVRG